MLTRRLLLISTVATVALLAAPRRLMSAFAAGTEQASAFVQQAGRDLVTVVNGPGSIADKQARLQVIIDRDVDVDAIARFCLGRYWRSANAQQQQQYLRLFHQVLLKNITGKLGEYQGVTFAVGRAVPREGGIGVVSVVTRASSAPANVEWIVGDTGAGPKIIDVVAEGTSLRLTQRSDYASYLSHNGDNVQALLDALRQQVSQSG